MTALEDAARTAAEARWPSWTNGTVPWGREKEDRHEFARDVYEEAYVAGYLARPMPTVEQLRLGVHRGLMSRVMTIFPAIGGKREDYDALLDEVADEVRALLTGDASKEQGQ